LLFVGGFFSARKKEAYLRGYPQTPIDQSPFNLPRQASERGFSQSSGNSFSGRFWSGQRHYPGPPVSLDVFIRVLPISGL
jgi:hypothetical protein